MWAKQTVAGHSSLPCTFASHRIVFTGGAVWMYKFLSTVKIAETEDIVASDPDDTICVVGFTASKVCLSQLEGESLLWYPGPPSFSSCRPELLQAPPLSVKS